MKNFSFRSFAVFALLLCSMVSMAHDLEHNGIYYKFVSAADYTIAVTYKGNSYDEYSGEYSGVVTIPATIDYYGTTYKVVSVGGNAFRNCAGLASVTIGANVSYFGGGDFYGCTALTSIKVVSENPYFDSRDNCNAIIISKTNTLYVGCRNTKIPSSVTSIEYAFYGCTGLTSITIPSSVTSIGNYTFYGCTALKSVEIPNSVTSIGSSAFEDCTGLTSIEIPSSVTSIGSGAFYGCENLKTVYNFSSLSLSQGSTTYYADKVINAPNGTIEGDFVFGVVDGVKTLCGYIGKGGDVTLPADYKGGNYVIGAIAFYNCTAIKSIEIPNSVTSIGARAFYGCSGLARITIPGGVTNIGENAFYGCNNLKTVVNLSSLSIGKGTDNGSVAYYADKVINAPNGSIEGDFVFGVVNGVNTLCGYIGKGGNVTLPADYKGENYVIRQYVFRNCTGLTSVTIPNSVTIIDDYAFYGCTGLTSVTIGNSVTIIGYSAFENCTGLTSIEIPNSVISIGYHAFENCTGLTSVTIPNSVTSIVDYTFNGCTALKSVEIPNSVTSIGNYTFNGCSGLTSIEIPSSVKSIGSSAFMNCTGLTRITIPSSVESIDNNAFYGCTNLKTIYNFSFLSLSQGATNNGYAAYYADKVINAPGGSIEGDFAFGIINGVNTLCGYIGNGGEVALPANYKGGNYVIGADVFKDNTAITGITIPVGVTSIGAQAFYNCTGLTRITIPSSVESIDNNAFYGCTNLKTIYNFSFLSLSQGTTNNGRVAYYADKVINAPGGSIEGDFAFGIINGVNTLCGYIGKGGNVTLPADYNGENYVIGADVFKNNTTITDITIPVGVTSIGARVFYGCSGLTRITIPGGVTNIGENAFYGCNNLKNVVNLSSLSIEKGSTDNGYVAYYADKVINIKDDFEDVLDGYIFGKKNGELALIGCRELYDSTLYLPRDYYGNKYVVADSAFAKIRGGSKWYLDIPNSVTAIGDYAFKGCFSYKPARPWELVIPASVASIGDGAFAGCPAIGELEIPATVKSIGDGAFKGCSRITDVIISAEISAIKNEMFYGCRSLKNITIPASVTSIGNEAFYNCDSLASIAIPNSVTSIGDGAFAGCAGLTSVEIPNNVTSIGFEAFTECDGLTNVKIGNSVTSIGDRAFYRSTNLQSVNIPAGVTYVGNIAFQYCDLRSLHLPASLVEIVDYAFSWNLNLSSITIDDENPVYSIPEGAQNILMETATNKVVLACKGAVIPETATSIGNGAFNGVGGIESITIPASITSIGDWAFDGCMDLVAIYSPSATPAKISSSSFTDTSTATLYVPIGAKDAYATAWGFKNIVETDFTGIGDVPAAEPACGSNRYYDLNGRRVENPTKGIYILDGKKVLVE